jgi:hypothetical protein
MKYRQYFHSQLIWFLADVLGLFSINMVSFSLNVGQSGSNILSECGPEIADVIGSCGLCSRAATDRIGNKELLVGLVCPERTAKDAELCHGLCEIKIEVTDATIS